ncbi:hypothetical protein [Natronococcus occultus]|uniref:Ferric reductase n=1 Tax=Natronococcus occultus SP4 TaxID=694430 RepID=L0K037_9EURY|nr:hypothetical protein [Natronococcus occultus]AGB37905.1 hypothetical protein Natoc_2120 [Natronococcus occultus SP4]
MTVDPFNRGKHHAAVVGTSLAMAALLWALGYALPRIIAAVPWFLLFFVMVIGPLTKLRPSIRRQFSGNFPLNWRSELGIWFVIWSLVHVLVVFESMGWDVIGFVVGMSAWAFAALVGVLLAVILALTSNNAAYQYMGPKAWKWHQSHGTYVMFWLLTVHIYDQVFAPGTTVPEDPLHLLYAATVLVVVTLHVGAFLKVVAHYRTHGEYPGSI